MTPKQEAALRQAVDAWFRPGGINYVDFKPYMDAIREALAEQPAPVAEPHKQQELEFVSPGGGYVPAIPRPMPLDWKLVPRKATPEMLKAMDECAQEGYDERLYAGMASSVYMAAWDASPVMGTLPEQPAQQQGPVTVLPDGSAFAVMSYPLPKDHWLYADRQYNDGEYEPVELGKPVLTHELRDAVVSAVRYAIRAATNCGKEVDFDPDALVQNAVYALCGPFTSPPASKPLTDEQRKAIVVCFTSGKVSVSEVQRKLAISYNEAQQLCQSIVDLGLAQGLQLAPSLDRHGIKGDA